MSETTDTEVSAENAEAASGAPNQGETAAEGSTEVKLNGLFAFKMGMSSVYNENGESIPVTVLKYEPWFVSQVKTEDKDGYSAVQLACRPRRASRTSQAQKGHLKGSGFENGAAFVRELRQALPEGLRKGQTLSLDSLQKGDVVKLSANSKGRGFSGSVKRWNFGGGPASHGSHFHRQPGSVGNRTWPGRVMPGKKFPGQFGDERVSVRNVKIVDVLPEERVVLVKGPVPGGRNTLVQLMKE